MAIDPVQEQVDQISQTSPSNLVPVAEVAGEIVDFRQFLPADVKERLSKSDAVQEDTELQDRLKAKAIRNGQKAAGLSGLQLSRTLDNFNADTPSQQAVLSLARKLISHIPEQRPLKLKKGLGLYGPSYGGKSHTLEAICNGVIEKCPSARVLIYSWESFQEATKNEVKGRGAEGEEAFVKKLLRQDILFVDEIQLLLTHPRDWVREPIKSLLWESASKGTPPLCIVSQYSPDELVAAGNKYIGPEVGNRLKMLCHWERLEGTPEKYTEDNTDDPWWNN